MINNYNGLRLTAGTKWLRESWAIRMPEAKGKSTNTLKDEDIKSIAEVVRTLLREDLDASLD